MAVSAVGQGLSVSAVRHGAATVLVFLTVFYYFYGPPMTLRMRDAAQQACNELTGNTFRTYRIEWRTASVSDLQTPHWACWDLGRPQRSVHDLGWWAGF